MLIEVLLALFIIVCLLAIVTILLQSGQEAGFAGAFGIGSGTQTVFGARAGTFLTRTTAVLIGMFMLLALVIVLLGSRGATPPPEAPEPEDLPPTTSAELPAGGAAQPAAGTTDTAAPEPAGTTE